MTLATLRSFALARRRVLGGLLLAALVLAGGYAVVRGSASDPTTVVVEPKPFVQEVAASGRVRAADEVAMSFETTGRVTRVLVEVGDRVRAGDPLVSLASGQLSAQLAAARAEVARRRAERASGLVSVEEVRREQDTRVANAYRTLLSEGLVARPQSGTYEMTPPVVSGAYGAAIEGTYKITVEKRLGLDDYDLLVFDLERDRVRASETGPTRLGTRGLFVSFPDGLRAYAGTTWYVQIPNPKSAAYLGNLNAYQAAERERTRAIEDAQASVAARAEGATVADAQLAAAQAEVARLEAELATYTLRAPFAGVVTAVDLDPGDTATPGAPAVTLISDQRLEIESFIPEINISYLTVSDPAVVTLDAFGEAVPFNARVIAIDPAETVRDGVSTYRVRFQFDDPEGRVKSGMTANLAITADRRDAVLAVPQGAVERRDGRAFVEVLAGEDTVRRPVVLGPVSSTGEIEIVEGLSPGERVILPGI